MFNEGILEEMGVELVNLLGVIRVNQHAIYLGIPTNVGHSRGAIFRTLVSRVKKN